MSDTKRKLREFMYESGFWIERMGKHLIWTNGRFKVTTAVSPSDFRAVRNVKSIVRRMQCSSMEQ